MERTPSSIDVLDRCIRLLREEAAGRPAGCLADRLDAELRPAALANDRRMQELQAAAEAQSRYMSFLSHDLRGSLNGVVLMLEVLRRELSKQPGYDESIEDIALMRQSIADAVGLMERHLQADRIRQGRVPLHPGPLAVRPVAEELARAAAPNPIAVEVPPDAVVNADPELFRQVLRNLLDNAVKHGGAADVRITAARNSDQWAITVADRGPGMEDDRLQQLLDPVRRAQLRERGVGLLIAQYAARLHHGSVTGHASPGAGVAVTLAVPASELPA